MIRQFFCFGILVALSLATEWLLGNRFCDVLGSGQARPRFRSYLMDLISCRYILNDRDRISVSFSKKLSFLTLCTRAEDPKSFDYIGVFLLFRNTCTLCTYLRSTVSVQSCGDLDDGNNHKCFFLPLQAAVLAL